MKEKEKVELTRPELEVLLDYATAQGHLSALHSPHAESAKKTVEELRMAVRIIRDRAGLPPSR
jgi:hypothetical protein